MTISEAVRTYLLSDPGVSALVGANIFPERAEDELTSDYLVYTVDLQPHDVEMNGPDTMIEARFEFGAVSASYDRAFEIAEAVRLALTYFKGVMGGTSGLRVEACWWVQTIALPKETPEQGLFATNSIFGIHYLAA